MKTHDPLCPDYPHARQVVCQCDLIAQVAERERLNAGMEGYAREVRREALSDLRAQVEALPPENVYSHRGPVVLRAVLLDLLDGEKPVNRLLTWRPR